MTATLGVPFGPPARPTFARLRTAKETNVPELTVAMEYVLKMERANVCRVGLEPIATCTLLNKYVAVEVKNDALVGTNVHSVQAKDDDNMYTCQSKQCDCSKIIYKIEDGNEDDLFDIDADTGNIMLKKSLAHLVNGKVYDLKISVANLNPLNSDGNITMANPKDLGFVQITIANGVKKNDYNYDLSEAVLNRQKRQVSVPATVDNITFTLSKTGAYNNTTTMFVGSKVHFQLVIQIPPSQSIDLSVELFSPENGTTIMVLCNPVITASGSNLQYNKTAAAPVQDANDGSINYDRAVFSFGTVVNNAVATGLASVIVIEWDVVMIDSPSTVNGSYYWNVSDSTPQFNMSGPSEIPTGSSAIFHVDAYIPYPSIEMNFDAFAPFNYTDAASVCSVLIVGVGVNYECYQYKNRPVTLYPSDTGITNDRGTLALGSVTNKGSREPNNNYTDNRISLEFVISIPYNESYIDNILWVGCTLELGQNQIWASQMSFKLASSPTTVLYPNDTTLSTYLFYPKNLVLNITIAPGTAANYSVEIKTDGVKYKICSVFYKARGANIPCFNPGDPVYSSDPSDLEINKATWLLGTLENKNQIQDFDANIFQLYIYLQPLDHSGLVLQETSTVTATVTVNSFTSTSSQTLTLTNTTAIGNAVNYTSPKANLTIAFGQSSVTVNQILDIRLNVSFYPKVINLPFTINLTAPTVSGVSQFSIVRAELMSVGKNLPCADRIKLNNSITYLTQPSESLSYQATLTVGSVCNVRPTASTTLTADDSLEIRAVILINNLSSLLTSGTFITSFVYSSDPIKNNSVVLSVGAATYTNYPVNSTPVVIFDYNSMNGLAIPAGYQLTSEILIKTPPWSAADWVIRADVSHDPELSLCAIIVKEYGYDIPYINTSKPSNTTKGSSSLVNKEAWLELNKVTNLGTKSLNNTPIFDDGSFVVQVVVQISKAATVSVNLKYVNVSVDYGVNGIDRSSYINFTVIAPGSITYNSAAALPNVTFFQSPVNENSTTVPSTNCYQGQVLILTTELSYPIFNGGHTLSTKISGPSDSTINIVDYSVVFIGTNFPCLSKQMYTKSFTATANNLYNYTGNIDLGMICTFPIFRTGSNNKIRIEAIVTVNRKNPLTAGSTLAFSSVVTINGSDTTYPLTLTVINSPLNQDFNLVAGFVPVVINASNLASSMACHSSYAFQATFTILANTSDVAILTVTTPLTSSSAVLTVTDFQIVSFGKNLGSVEIPFPTSTTFSSTKLTSQNDIATINLGRITNTGHTYRAETYMAGDNDITVVANIQMADAISVLDQSPWSVTFSSTYLSSTATGLGNVTAVKSDADPVVLVISDFEITNGPYNAGDKATVTINIRHDDLSKTELDNVFLHFYIPKFMDYAGNFQSDFKNTLTPVVNSAAGNKYFSINFAHLYFTDNVTSSFDLSFLAGIMTSTAASETVRIAYELEYDIKSKPTVKTQQAYPIKFINFTMVASPFKFCPTEASLGMGSSVITDCQITGSPGSNDYVESRPGKAGWSPLLRKGKHKRYLQVNLANIVKITKVQITQKSTDKINSFMLRYSNDGLIWKNGDLLTAPNDNSVNDVTVTNPVDSSFVRFQIESTYTADTIPTFTIEFYGCITTSLVLTATEICDVRKGWQPTPAIPSKYY
ncbi:hypothetical protein HELRODRAFT_179552 [Helobdella robusta]|uniref:F5/8 type C domain-containing protein n=1 Tax=Helobdella robusta TaxID=6412 RepID=T1FEV2_HELRO|nr:hypothetical protein HELRODRAFT_179552 [Helobdella robusta]ESN95220.1 hypothetical protein HELRODRAFT_179552 [Helobdella robusta]